MYRNDSLDLMLRMRCSRRRRRRSGHKKTRVRSQDIQYDEYTGYAEYETTVSSKVGEEDDDDDEDQYKEVKGRDRPSFLSVDHSGIYSFE